MHKEAKLANAGFSDYHRGMKSESPVNLVALLLKDHRAMRTLMRQIKSRRATPAQVHQRYARLKKLVTSHMAAEELALLNPLHDHPKFSGEATEGWEEHRVHEEVMAGIARLRDRKRQTVQMKIFCEILEHHLKEEEADLFPDYQKHFALSTRKKTGQKFLRRRIKTKAGLSAGALANE